MIEFDVILLLAGKAERCELGYNKVLYEINGKPVFIYSLEKFLSFEKCRKVVIVAREKDIDAIKEKINNKYISRINFVIGGRTRQESVSKGLEEVRTEYVLIHDGARPCISYEDIAKVIKELEHYDCVSLGTQVKECTRYIDEKNNCVLKRENLISIKTPQGLKKDLLTEGLKKANYDKKSFYDDVSVVEEYFDISPKIVIGDEKNIKVTTKEDLEIIETMLGEKMNFRIGHANDTHQLVENRKLIIGGIEIPFELGLNAHSDGDVLYHSISEAIIGALGEGDLGTHFSDKDEQYKDISSSYFLIKVKEMLDLRNYEIQNIDATVFIEKPMMFPYIPQMRKNISELLNIDLNLINIKATRGEKVGIVGRSEAVVSEAVVLIKKK